MPKFDEERMVINGVKVSVPQYLRTLAQEPMYANQKYELLQWARQYEEEKGEEHIVF